ncbi:MAG: hypothetical protein EBT55_06210, partial [Proteobacteria bacterium]|nr:hypothetical protein [Pseudomonadota bacterium]
FNYVCNPNNQVAITNPCNCNINSASNGGSIIGYGAYKFSSSIATSTLTNTATATATTTLACSTGYNTGTIQYICNANGLKLFGCTPPLPSAGITSLTMWLEAKDNLTPSFGLKSIADNSNISKWQDLNQRGENQFVFQPVNNTLGNEIRYSTNGILFAGNNSLQATLANNNISRSSLFNSNQTTIFIVQQSSNTSTENSTTLAWNNATKPIYINAYNQGSLDFYFGRNLLLKSNFYNTNSAILSFTKNGNTLISHQNAIEVSRNANATDTITTDLVGNLFIGSYNSSTNRFKGKIAEIIIYNTALTDAERVNVFNYLATKWNVNKVCSTFNESDLGYNNISQNSFPHNSSVACNVPGYKTSLTINCPSYGGVATTSSICGKNSCNINATNGTINGSNPKNTADAITISCNAGYNFSTPTKTICTDSSSGACLDTGASDVLRCLTDGLSNTYTIANCSANICNATLTNGSGSVSTQTGSVCNTILNNIALTCSAGYTKTLDTTKCNNTILCNTSNVDIGTCTANSCNAV